MTNDDHRWAINMYAEDMRELGQFPIEPDWMAVIECGAFKAIRQGRLPILTSTPSGRVEPVWDGRQGPPKVASLRVVVVTDDGTSLSTEISTTYLQPLAKELSAQLVENGVIKAGNLFRYRVCAYPTVGKLVDNSAPGLVIEEIGEPLPVHETPLQPFMDASALQASGLHGPVVDGDFPVFLRKRVMEQAVEMAQATPQIEAGGVLVGKLHRDPDLHEIFVEITALIPACHTLAQAAKLTFTAETWAAVDAALDLRHQSELMAGWAHSHPDWCRTCAPEKRRTCTATNAFFSADDVDVHKVCFNRAFHTAILIADSATTGLSCSLFGWRQGMIQQRGFYLLEREPVFTREQDEIVIDSQRTVTPTGDARGSTT